MNDSPAPKPAPESRPAFYALSTGGWRDYVTLLHVPYTVWHLSYVALGWAVSGPRDVAPLVASLTAFFLAVGIGAHALDELNGRPLGTRIPTPALVAAAVVSVAMACGIGVAAASRTNWWLLAFVAFGGFIVCAYNLELFRGRFHTDVWFALAWGGFPTLTASWANGERFTVAGVLLAAACFYLSLAQRTLSTPVRDLRRRTEKVSGTIRRTDGTVSPVNAGTIRRPMESALELLSIAMPLLAAAAVAMRLA